MSCGRKKHGSRPGVITFIATNRLRLNAMTFSCATNTIMKELVSQMQRPSQPSITSVQKWLDEELPGLERRKYTKKTPSGISYTTMLNKMKTELKYISDSTGISQDDLILELIKT